MYTIVDIETTGNGILRNKITEIAIFKFDGHTVIDEYTSLINPLINIPPFITSLTGIDNSAVQNAPVFKEVAHKIEDITRDSIFVAHNVNFDYNVLKNEFKQIGVDFTRKKLCTVRLSRKLLPGYNSYSLGKLTSALGIPLTDRHRARGDAHATVLLFQKLLGTENADSVFKKFLDSKSQEGTFPPALPRQEYEKLPTRPGVYYFKDKQGTNIYIGKAINIKKRVLSHFYDKKTKEILLCNETAYLDFEETGNELIALLKESAEIKKEYPKYNRAQKKTIQQYGIFTYQDRNGIMHIAFNKIKMTPNPIVICYSLTEARQVIEAICEEFALCPKYCHLQENVQTCSHYKLKQCIGICSNIALVEKYNLMVTKAIATYKSRTANFIILDKGRTEAEHGFVVVQNSTYVGYGFIPVEIAIKNTSDLETFLIPQKNTYEAQRITDGFARKYPKKVFII